MRQFKSDGRYKYHNLGFHYIVDFRWQHREDRLLFVKLIGQFKEMYGDHIIEEPNAHGFPIKKFNPDYHYEQSFSAKRRRFYLREESALTLALLKVGT